MKIVTNEKYIRRNKKIGQYTTIASLAILVIGFIISLDTSNPGLFGWSLLALVIGFALSQVGIYFGNRWGRSPRPDEVLAAGLKGLEDKYTLYNYMTVVPHLLVGPAGIWILATFTQRGAITYNPDRKRWSQKGGNFIMKLFGQEGLGRPDQEVYNLYQDMQKYISKEVSIPNLPSPQVAMVFLSDKSTVQAQDSPVPAMHIEKLKDFIRKQAKENIYRADVKDPDSVDPVRRFQQFLPEESIV
ncbi:MAG TPA: hypothetical protein VMS73_05435 [Anaerolineaceae bacterium]|nr:hypothetical protein [Anaerolineaceae bacterium]